MSTGCGVGAGIVVFAGCLRLVPVGFFDDEEAHGGKLKQLNELNKLHRYSHCLMWLQALSWLLVSKTRCRYSPWRGGVTVLPTPTPVPT